MRNSFRLHIWLTLMAFGCAEKDIQTEDKLFNLLPASQTGINFINEIKEDDSLNVLNYEYMYNGGGVGILDVNNDGLSDIFFTGNQVPNVLYLNEGNLQFKDISKSAGVELENHWCTGVSIVDLNYDGYDDIYVCVGGPGNESIFPNKLLINQGDLTFVEMASEYGLADPGESNQATFFDYDKDGDLDMYLLTGGGLERSAITVKPILTEGQSRNTDQLYRNSFDSLLGHPVFTNVSKEAGVTIEGYGLGVSVIDANQDSWPDVYVSNDYLSRDLLYINNQDGTFTDRSLEYFKHTSHFSMGNDVGDVNNDGLMDIVTLDMLPSDPIRQRLMFDPNQYHLFYQAVSHGYGYQYMRNMLHLNHGKDGFSEIGQLAGIDQTDWSWSPLLADLNNDGYLDLYITNGFGKDITDLDFVNFRREAFAPFADQMKMRSVFLDSTNRRPPIELSNFIFRNEKDLTFSDQSEEWGIKIPSMSNGAAFADLDDDGDLEIIVNNINREPFIFKNNSAEKNPSENNFIKVRLSGPELNPAGFGAKISLFHNGKSQHRYHQVARGFESSVEKTVHFGMGADSISDSLIVVWPDGKRNIVSKLSPNTTVKIDYKFAQPVPVDNIIASWDFFTTYRAVDHKHKEIDYNDFRAQPSLISGFSNQGPGIAIGDVNGDGLDDFFVGGAYGASGKIFAQNKNGSFSEKEILTSDFEDLGAVFFDSDGDGDQDLYVASGGSERYAGHANYRDRLYINDGKGNFQLNHDALPETTTSTSSVTAGDFDLDGDLDLFVGGRLKPTRYPEAPDSYILRNDHGKFTDVTSEVCPDVRNIGMVTSASWTDFNNDSRPDLVIVGEFMRITFLENESGKLIGITDETLLADSHGMWNSILPADLDNDGDMDYVVGNLGLNTPFKASVEKPFKVYFADFDKNGTIDPIFSVYEKDTELPYTTFDQLKTQLPIVTKYINSYGKFARSTTEDILHLYSNTENSSLSCTTLSTSVIENKGNNQFDISSLPNRAQFAPVNGILAEDINLDGLLDLILVGNNYSPEVTKGRYDASAGAVLINQGNLTFKSLAPSETEFFVNGNAKGMVRLESANDQSLLVITQNNDELKSLTIEGYTGLKRVKFLGKEMRAILTFSDGSKRKMEYQSGSSYMSQSSRSVVVTPSVDTIEFFDEKGNLTRKLNLEERTVQ